MRPGVGAKKIYCANGHVCGLACMYVCIAPNPGYSASKAVIVCNVMQYSVPRCLRERVWGPKGADYDYVHYH